MRELAENENDDKNDDNKDDDDMENDESDKDEIIVNEINKKRTKRQQKHDKNEERKQKYEAAIAGFQSGHYKSVNACAKTFGVNQGVLAGYLRSGNKFVGAGKQSIVFTKDEEERIVQFVIDRVNLGVGVDFHQLSLIIQELLIELKKGDKERYIPPSWEKCYPQDTFVRRFADRNNISLREAIKLEKKYF